MKTSLHRLIQTATLLLLATSARAGTLTPSPLGSVTGPGTASATATTVTPNNYPTTLSPNTLIAPSIINGFSAPLDLLIKGVNSVGTTQYAVTAAVTNNTGVASGNFTFELGLGTGASFLQFLNPGPETFDPTTPVPTSTALPVYAFAPEIITFSGGTFASGSTATFTFNLTIADDTTGGAPTFTLRETIRGSGAIPEPGSFAMIGLAILGGLGFAWHRRQAAA